MGLASELISRPLNIYTYEIFVYIYIYLNGIILVDMWGFRLDLRERGEIKLGRGCERFVEMKYSDWHI